MCAVVTVLAWRMFEHRGRSEARLQMWLRYNWSQHSCTADAAHPALVQITRQNHSTTRKEKTRLLLSSLSWLWEAAARLPVWHLSATHCALWLQTFPVKEMAPRSLRSLFVDDVPTTFSSSTTPGGVSRGWIRQDVAFPSVLFFPAAYTG